MLAQTYTCQMASSEKALGSKLPFLMQTRGLRLKAGPFALPTSLISSSTFHLGGGLVFNSCTALPFLCIIKVSLKSSLWMAGEERASSDFTSSARSNACCQKISERRICKIVADGRSNKGGPWTLSLSKLLICSNVSYFLCVCQCLEFLNAR